MNMREFATTAVSLAVMAAFALFLGLTVEFCNGSCRAPNTQESP